MGMQTDNSRAGVWATAFLAAAISCVDAPRIPQVPGLASSLRLAGEFAFPVLIESGILDGQRFGGVSALAFDPSTGDLLGLSDDSRTPRVFVLGVSGEGASFRVDLKSSFPLEVAGDGARTAGASGERPAGHEDDRPAALDPEGLAIAADGRLFVASEGLPNSRPRVQPGIYEYSRGQFVRALEVPEKFIQPSDGPVVRGVRANAAFESLTLTPGDRTLFTATESAVVQDGSAADFDHGAPSRIVQYEARNGTFVPRREFVYEVDAVARPDFTARFSINGLVELLAFSDTDLLSMERSYAEESADGRHMNRIRIYQISLQGATDVSGLGSLQGASGIVPVRKKLVVDFSALRGLSPALRSLDNFEGLTFGPRGPRGGTLITVSDDNFSALQRTVFLLLRNQ